MAKFTKMTETRTFSEAYHGTAVIDMPGQFVKGYMRKLIVNGRLGRVTAKEIVDLLQRTYHLVWRDDGNSTGA